MATTLATAIKTPPHPNPTLPAANTPGVDADHMYRQYYETVLRYVRARVASREIAEDLVGDIFCRAVAKADAYRALRDTPLPWLYRIAAHRVADHYRRLRPTCALEVALEVAAPGPDPAEVVVQSVAIRDVWLASRSLPATQRRALWLRFGAELELREIAEIMGKSVEAVKLLIHRALRRIRANFALQGSVESALQENRGLGK